MSLQYVQKKTGIIASNFYNIFSSITSVMLDVIKLHYEAVISLFKKKKGMQISNLYHVAVVTDLTGFNVVKQRLI